MDSVKVAAQAMIDCYRAGGKILVCGNGGSAADSGHIVGELVKGFLKKRPLSAELQDAIGEEWAAGLQMGLPAIDLTAHGPLISAVTNDIDGRSCYAQQVMAYGKPGDILIGISTSGNAENVCRALKTARALGLVTVGMTGAGGGKMAELCDMMMRASCTETYRVQEEHIRMYHAFCILVEEAFFAE